MVNPCVFYMVIYGSILSGRHIAAGHFYKKLGKSFKKCIICIWQHIKWIFYENIKENCFFLHFATHKGDARASY